MTLLKHLFLALMVALPAVALAEAPLPIKVVVVTMFETGEDTGDQAGEFQRWYERQKLNTVYPAPHMHHDIMVNKDTGVLGIVTGMGTANSAASVMALGLYPRFDLSQAYWLVAGISGFDPADASLGSVAWAEWLVDGDLAHQIDAREKNRHDHRACEQRPGSIDHNVGKQRQTREVHPRAAIEATLEELRYCRGAGIEETGNNEQGEKNQDVGYHPLVIGYRDASDVGRPGQTD